MCGERGHAEHSEVRGPRDLVGDHPKAGGVTLGKVDLDATVRGSEYHVVSHLQTDGVVNAFWKSTIQAIMSSSAGHV